MGKTEREMNHERLWTPGNKLRVLEGRGARPVKGVKEGMYCVEHCMLYANN